MEKELFAEVRPFMIGIQLALLAIKILKPFANEKKLDLYISLLEFICKTLVHNAVESHTLGPG